MENNDFPVEFIYENDTIKQTVKIQFMNDDEIKFQLNCENKMRNQNAFIEGIAKSKDGDLEIDEDEEGNAYPVIEFIYEKDCWLAFRIDLDTRSILRIHMADCTPNPYCPFSSVGILNKIIEP
jgi:hypothetical protein